MPVRDADIRRQLSLEDTVRQSHAIHPDWTPNDHAWFLHTDEATPTISLEGARRLVAQMFDVSACCGVDWDRRTDETQPVFVTRGRLAMRSVMRCSRCGGMTEWRGSFTNTLPHRRFRG